MTANTYALIALGLLANGFTVVLLKPRPKHRLAAVLWTIGLAVWIIGAIAFIALGWFNHT
jgi:hypothetical protein